MSEYTREEILKLIEENGGSEGLDLSGKDLSEIDLGREAIEAELEKAQARMPGEIPVWYSEQTEGINLRGADLQEAVLREANLQRAFLWDAKLQEATLAGANLQGAYLVNANLQGANLWGANLQGALLWDADLQVALLGEANLQEAELRLANLQGAELWLANLQGAFFSGLRLDHTEMARGSLGPAIGEELEGRYSQARDAYLRLKQNFDGLGDHAASSWAYRKERRMEKLEALQEARKAWQKRDWKGAVPRYAKAGGDQLVELVCDYGESVGRVLVSLAVVYVLFTLMYGLTWSVIRVRVTSAATIREPTRNLVDVLRFSLGAMTTMDMVGLEPRNGLVELLAGLEALLGIFLAGLLGFVAGNRIRRS